MMKKFLVAIFAVGSLWSGAQAAEYEVSLLMVPREETPVQVAFDLGGKGYPIMLLAWQMKGGKPVIHAWNGTEWLYVSLEDYKSGRFFSRPPARALLVGSEGNDVSAALIPASSWCSQIVHTDTAELRKLLNFVGTQFDFPWPHWDWFARRYGFQVQEINPDYRNDRWYYHRLTDYVARKLGRRPATVPMEREVERIDLSDDFSVIEPVPVPEKQVEVIDVPLNPVKEAEIAPAEIIEEAPGK